MKKKINKRNSDFFSYAKDTVGETRFKKAIARGHLAARELKLKSAREQIGLAQSDLRGMTQPEVSKIESRKDVKISTLNKYATAMGMRVKISLVPEDEDDNEDIAIYG